VHMSTRASPLVRPCVFVNVCTVGCILSNGVGGCVKENVFMHTAMCDERIHTPI
jgi:hypothetical protein